VALGRALMLGTRLVLLDEPFQGLAPVLANRYAEALRALRDSDRELSLLITESNPGLLATIAGRTVTIERGEIEQAAELERV
jgi:branched-chain amino acid transport system ATP-binding protein